VGRAVGRRVNKPGLAITPDHLIYAPSHRPFPYSNKEKLCWREQEHVRDWRKGRWGTPVSAEARCRTLPFPPPALHYAFTCHHVV